MPRNWRHRLYKLRNKKNNFHNFNKFNNCLCQENKVNKKDFIFKLKYKG